MQEPDPVAVRAAAAGDLDAFGQLVHTYQEPLWRFLWHLTGDRVLAEDLAQETFLRAFDRIGSFRFESRFSTWLYRIGRNTAIDAMRRRDRRRDLPRRISPRDDEPGPELGLEMSEALATLSEKLRETLLLVEITGLTCQEAGMVLGVPEGTVKSRLYHARRHLVTWFRASEEAAGG